jgi:hypothetical protein
VADPVDPLTNPGGATIADLVASVRKFRAGTMTLAGRGAAGEVKFLVLVAVDEEAARLEPEIERLTDAEEEHSPRKRKGARRG